MHKIRKCLPKAKCPSDTRWVTTLKRQALFVSAMILFAACKKDKLPQQTIVMYKIEYKRFMQTKSNPPKTFWLVGEVARVVNNTYIPNTGYVPQKGDIISFDVNGDGLMDKMYIIPDTVKSSNATKSKVYSFKMTEINSSTGTFLTKEFTYDPSANTGINPIKTTTPLAINSSKVQLP